jgi:hypothetical protein
MCPPSGQERLKAVPRNRAARPPESAEIVGPARRVVPFLSSDLVSLTDKEAAIKASCAKALRSVKSQEMPS